MKSIQWIRILCVASILLTIPLPLRGGSFPVVRDVEAQPLMVQVERLRQAMEYLGVPLSEKTIAVLDKAAGETDEAAVRKLVQEALDPYCLLGVVINPESRVKVVRGPADAKLVENGWRQFLLKVHNQAGVRARLEAASPQAKRLAGSLAPEIRDRWLDMQMFEERPLEKTLGSLELEYRIVQLYSRDVGKRAAVFSFNVGQGSQDLGFRNDVTVTFDCLPSEAVMLEVLDEDGTPTTAGLEIRDAQGRVYPSQAKRLAPDFSFHPQVYRSDGDRINLPAGQYTIDYSRGPEYLPGQVELKLDGKPRTLTIQLERWVDPAQRGWWSGDHHIHAAGCAHYSSPSEGVHAKDMMLHCLGEDLKVGCNLTWGPGFDYQKQFFTGKEDEISQYPYLLRYDVEVSGFGSHRSGHLCLLRLKDQIPPGGESTDHWPTLCLNTLRWAKKQGAVCGPAHSGWGLKVPGDELPNYHIPPYDSIGANEYIVDVTHNVPGPDGELVPAVDFMSLVDTPPIWELNMWYHTLNCGFRTRVSGETDFPCIYGERVGLGRSYVKLDGRLDYDSWCESVRDGRCYVSDGRSHLMDMMVNDQELGVAGSEFHLPAPGTVRVTAAVAAYLSSKIPESFESVSREGAPYWHIERARIGDSREVKVELVVNGYPVAEQNIVADGSMRDIVFETNIDRSSWVTMRIFPSSHTNPIFVLVDGKPIRASRRSAEWCQKGVEQCWSQKKSVIDEDEMADAVSAYDHARKVYAKILAECEVE